VVDYVGVNVGKPLHIGHLCAPSIGQAIINSYRHRGFRVIGDIHQGDWGKSLASPPYFTHAKNGFLKLKDGAMSNREKDIVFD